VKTFSVPNEAAVPVLGGKLGFKQGSWLSMTNEEWRDYFTKRLHEAEKRLEDAKAPGWRLIEKTANGERDITAQHLKWLQSEVDEYRKVLK